MTIATIVSVQDSVFEYVQRLTGVLQPISFIWIHAEPILLAMKHEPEIAQLAAAYLFWSTLELPGSSLFITLF